MSYMLDWKTPPGADSGRLPSRGKWVRIAEQLRERAGQWALVYVGPSKNAASCLASEHRTGRTPAFRPAGHYEVRQDGCDVYARYVGERK